MQCYHVDQIIKSNQIFSSTSEITSISFVRKNYNAVQGTTKTYFQEFTNKSYTDWEMLVIKNRWYNAEKKMHCDLKKNSL